MDDEQRADGHLIDARGVMRRRRLLGLLGTAIGAGSLGSLLAACTPAAPAAPTAAATAAPKPTGAATTAAPTAAAAVNPTTAPAAATAAASGIDTSNMRKGGTLVEASTLTVDTLAPVIGSNRAILFVFDTLTYTDPDTLQPMPNLATKWETTPDGKTYTFTLKDGVRFHDGAPLTADDVKFTFDLLLNPETASPYRSGFAGQIDAVEARGPNTVVVTLKQPVASFLVDLYSRSIGILPKHLLGDLKPADVKASDFAQSKPVGSGPFKVKEFKPGESLTLEANSDYHRGAPQLAQYVLKLVKDATVAYQQLKTAEADVALITADFYDDAKRQANVTPVAYETFGLYWLGFNLDATKGSPALRDAKVRQALSYAVDRQLIVDRVYSGLGTVVAGAEPAASWANQPEKMTVSYAYDPKKAAALLDEAGWAPGPDGIRAKDGQKLSFSAYGQTGRKPDEGSLLAIQDFFKAIGVDLSPQFEPAAAWAKRVYTDKDFDASFQSFTFGPDPDLSLAWDSKSAFNAWSYSNPRVDALLAQGIATADMDKRKAIYSDLQNALLADAPAIFVSSVKNVTGVNKRVRNYVPSAVGFNWAAHAHAHLWYVTDGR